MPRKNRITLIESFKSGKKPTEQDFVNLIDSNLNILDDGFSKSPEIGMGLAPLLEKGTVISIFKESSDQQPQWEVAINVQNKNLEIRRYNEIDSIPLISLKPDGSIEVAEKDKDCIFGGTVKIPVREGHLYRGTVLADGKWHNITPELDGCQALEVVAVVGKQHTGKHAILVAMTTSCFGQHGRITKTRSNYGMYGYRLCIRWKKNRERKSQLQLKTLLKYGDDIHINYHISSLWNNNLINE